MLLQKMNQMLKMEEHLETDEMNCDMKVENNNAPQLKAGKTHEYVFLYISGLQPFLAQGPLG